MCQLSFLSSWTLTYIYFAALELWLNYMIVLRSDKTPHRCFSCPLVVTYQPRWWQVKSEHLMIILYIHLFNYTRNSFGSMPLLRSSWSIYYNMFPKPLPWISTLFGRNDFWYPLSVYLVITFFLHLNNLCSRRSWKYLLSHSVRNYLRSKVIVNFWSAMVRVLILYVRNYDLMV